MTNQAPLVSVIIPCYNYGRFLADAVNSVLDQQKDGVAVEAIVVDDGSTDDTPVAAEGLGSSIRYIRQENQGLSAARNTGMRAARGDFLIFLDADDLLTPHVISSHLKNFDSCPDTDASMCRCIQVFKKTGRAEGEMHWWPFLSAQLDMHLCQINIAPVHAIMLRSSAARDAGFFDTSLKACEDQDYWLRCAALGKRFKSNPDGKVIYRMHGQNMTDQRSQQLIHDGVLHFKITKLLENVPDFPMAGKFYGWLAHATGCVCAVESLVRVAARRMALKLLEESARAMLKAAAHTRSESTEDPYLIHAERYFTSLYLSSARLFLGVVPCLPLERAAAFLEHHYRGLAALSDDALDARVKKAFSQLHI